MLRIYDGFAAARNLAARVICYEIAGIPTQSSVF
jgi:hypothetical protein